MPSIKNKSEWGNRAALLLLVLWIVYNALATNVFGRQLWPDAIVDYRILYDFSRSVVATHCYPPYYAYPPSSVVFQYVTALPPFPIAAALFMALTIFAAVACWFLLHQLLFAPVRQGHWGLVLLACLSSDYFFQWDLRSQNCNILFLACLLAGIASLQKRRQAFGTPDTRIPETPIPEHRNLRDRNAMQAGFWIAVSIALKLFPVVLLPYLLWKGEKRALGWLLVFSLVFWLLLPLLVFSPHGMAVVYHGWLGQLNIVSQSSRIDLAHPILISLDRSAQWIAGHTHRSSVWIVTLVRLFWAVLLLLGLALSRRRSKTAAGQSNIFGLLTDISLIILLPIALSAYLEPYHAVPFAIVALLLLQAGADSRLPKRTRATAWITFALSYLVLAIPTPFEIRGLMVNCKLLVSLAGLLLVGWQRAQALNDLPGIGKPGSPDCVPPERHTGNQLNPDGN